MVCLKLVLVLSFIASPYFLGRASVRRITGTVHAQCLKPFDDFRVGLLTHQLGQALVCGRSLPSGNLKNVFTDLGIYHVLVVSGAHLTWITTIIMFLLPGSSRFSFFLLVLYTLMTGAQAPVVRALLEQGFRHSKVPSWVGQIFAMLGSLIFQPLWWNSRSLFLSALARQAILRGSSIFQQTLRIQLVLLPLLIDFANPSLIGWISACGLSVGIELVLFPILVGVGFFPELSSLSEPLLEFFMQFLREIHAFLPQDPKPLFQNIPLVPWAYWFLSFGILLKLQFNRNRRWYFS